MEENDLNLENYKRENFILDIADMLISIVKENRYLRERNKKLEKEIEKNREWLQYQVDHSNDFNSSFIKHLLDGNITINK